MPDHSAPSVRRPGPVALVTGAGRGIGRAITLRLAAAGYQVLATDRSGDLANETARLGGVRVLARELDACDREAVGRVAAEVWARFGRLELVVNNAMWLRYAPLAQITVRDVDRMLDIGVKAPLWMSQAVSEPMAEGGGGAIVNIASVAALRGTPHAAVYSAAKGALVSMTRQLAGELGPRGIRVNAIAPGTIATPGVRAALSSQARADRVRRAPLGRLGEPSEIADAVLYLGGPSANFVTGQLLVVDGGITAAL